ncbi:MAG TPA: CheR family methyltransferase, partial [Polyangiaceae bacterium]|nr:CheR family methyltransferase [Polyangiaceae bacterium]
MAFVVVQHQSPSFESRMEELLGRQTRVAICMAEEGASLHPDTIYLAPADKNVSIVDSRIALRVKDPSHAYSLPIDELFSSIADCFGARSVAVVLSGTGRDGSRGIVDVHRSGGLVMAQLPETAKFDGMPRNAVEAGVVDEVLPPEQLGEALQRLLREPQEGASRLACSPAVEAAVREILGLLRKQHGIDFTHYKPSTVMRRVERRLMLGPSGDIDAYLAMLRTNAVELNALYHDLLIGVTSFFRDTEAFDALEQQILPAIVSAAKGEEEVRAWVAGCATGEEPYALAMLFKEQLAQLENPPKLTVFATDVHGASLETAALGRYRHDALAGVGPARLERWFEPDGAAFYRVKKELRDSVVFARHDVLSDAPFTRLDFVSCRNLLIYLKVPAQMRVLSLFHFGLKQGGFLFLGRSESLGGIAEAFDSLDASAKIYRKVSGERPTMANYAPLTRMPSAGIDVGTRRATESRLMRLYDRLLDNHVPPSVLVDERQELVHCFAGAERYLRVPTGRMSSNILDIVDASLRAALSAALHHASTRRVGVAYDSVELHRDNEPAEQLRLKIDTLIDARSGSTAYHVIFESLGPKAPVEENAPVDAANVSRDYLQSLESQLQATRESLQATVEALQASNEELQATNEELLSSNEQLQSTNEELHSVNEELHSVNAESERRIKELTELNNDIDNLLCSIDVGVLFVDRELRIRRFTKKAADVFNLLHTDVGRRFPSFAPGS